MLRAEEARLRTHIVLVPGFAGFDALGQLEYYSGVTAEYGRWRPHGLDVALHYFDNLPTAAVETRSRRLGRWLAKRMVRGQIGANDRIALVGHSTGGLDIRALILGLHEKDRYLADLDGTSGEIHTRALLARIQRVVFLSVPQFGTNIAHWVREHGWLRRRFVTFLRSQLTAARVSSADHVQRAIVGRLPCLNDTELLLAVRDALADLDEEAARADRSAFGPTRLAAVHQAEAELGSWLRHIDGDFAAIDDLAPDPPDGRRDSPAHWDRREDELKLWEERGLRTLSIATVGRCPFDYEGRPPARLALSVPWTQPWWLKQVGGTDATYRWCYAACADGPLNARAASLPTHARALAPDLPGGPLETTPSGTGRVRKVEAWENDGIVNTVSMLWPHGDRTWLVEGDHGDIIGHHDRVPVAQERRDRTSRAFRAYDLLGSGSGFHADQFRRVWSEVFAFCAQPEGADGSTGR